MNETLIEKEHSKAKLRLIQDIIGQSGGVAGWFVSSAAYWAKEAIAGSGFAFGEPIEFAGLSELNRTLESAGKVTRAMLKEDKDVEADDLVDLLLTTSTLFGVPAAPIP